MRITVEFTIPADTAEINPERLEVQVIPGVLNHVEIDFLPGCAHMVHVRVLSGLTSIVPLNPSGSIHGDWITRQIDMQWTLSGAAPYLILEGWSDGTGYDHTIPVAFDIEPESEDVLDLLLDYLDRGAPLTVEG